MPERPTLAGLLATGGPTWEAPADALDLTALRSVHEKIVNRRPFEERWLVVVPPALEDRARSAMEANGIPTSCLRVTADCPADKLYLIDRKAFEEIPDA